MQIEQPIDTPTSSLTSKLMRNYGKLGGKLGLAIIDQGLFAVSNFLVNVLLARWMMPDEYGAYAVGFAWFLIAQNLYEALVTEPMAIFGAGKYSKHAKSYFGAAFIFHIWFSILVAVPFFVMTNLIEQNSALVQLVLLATALLMPALLARWLFRQPFYIMSHIGLAVVGSLIYLVSALLTTMLFHLVPSVQTHLTLYTLDTMTTHPVFWVIDGSWLNPFTAVLSNAIAGGFTALVMIFFYVKPSFRNSAEINRREVYATHLKYGRWSSIDRLLMWFPSNIFYIVIPIMYDLSVSGALRALSNIEMPFYLTLTAIGAVLLPSFVRTYANDGYDALIRRVKQVRLLLLVMTGALGLVLAFAGQWIMHVLYDGNFDAYVNLLLLVAMGVHLVLFGLVAPLDLSLRARGLVKQNFIARVLPSLLTLTLGIYLLYVYGLLGVKLAAIITTFVHLLVLIYLNGRMNPHMTQPDAVVPTGDSL